MPTYTVTWENEIYNASSPEEAARDCVADIQNMDALCFTVVDNSTGKKYSVDLNDQGDRIVSEIKE